MRRNPRALEHKIAAGVGGSEDGVTVRTWTLILSGIHSDRFTFEEHPGQTFDQEKERNGKG
jgi:hypothetical protein